MAPGTSRSKFPRSPLRFYGTAGSEDSEPVLILPGQTPVSRIERAEFRPESTVVACLARLLPGIFVRDGWLVASRRIAPFRGTTPCDFGPRADQASGESSPKQPVGKPKAALCRFARDETFGKPLVEH
ncbi:hypothetical protein PABG_11904 [Paracoccidioides brasiliensis Pb03]|nr:hypothetical protein PABG_11904 [Paracoccidioides brasiliensis Pb03]